MKQQQDLHHSCLEHVDIMIEEWVNTYELAPEIELMEDKIKTPCSWCEQDAIYCIIPMEVDDDN